MLENREKASFNVTPCFYLRCWQKASLNQIQKISQVGHPVFIHAEDLQKFENAIEFMELFEPEQLHILSFDVDDKESDLSIAIKACDSLEKSHLFVIDQYSSELVDQLEFCLNKALERPTDLISISGQKKTHRFQVYFNDVMFSGSPDYRNYGSSFCIYPVSAIKKIDIGDSSRFDHLKILLAFLQKKGTVSSVEVEKGFTDSRYSWGERCRKSVYDFRLLIQSVIRQEIKPLRSSISLAMGVFFASSPFYGLQTLFIFLTAIIFRLNFPVAFLGSQFSLPPLYFFLIGLELYVGSLLTGQQVPYEKGQDLLVLVQEFFEPLLMGWFAVGLPLAVLLGLLWFIFMSRRKA